MDAVVSFLNIDFSGRLSGVEISALLRSRIFKKYLHVTPNLLTCKFNPQLSDVIQKLKNDEVLPEPVPTFNMYDYFQAAETFDPEENDASRHFYSELSESYRLVSVPNTSDYKVFDRAGSRVAYVAHDRPSGKLLYINHFIDNVRSRCDIYDCKGFLSRTRHFSEGGYVTEEEFRRPNGTVAIRKVLSNISEAEPPITLVDEEGGIQKTYYSEDEMKRAWIDVFLGDGKSHIFIIDKNAAFLKPVIDILRDQKDCKRLTALSVIHASHTKDARNPQESRIKNAYLPLFDTSNGLASIIALTGKQKFDIESRFATAPLKVIGHAYDLNTKPIEFADRKRFTMVYVARYSPEKNHHLALQAMKIIVDVIPEARLECYGFGDKILSQLNDLVKKLGLERNVVLNGFNDQIASIYDNAGLSVLTSESESFSLATMESLCHGCPVVSFDVPYGPLELIRSGHNGYLVKYSDVQRFAKTIIDIFTDIKLHKTLSKNAYQDAVRFTPAECSKKWKELLTSLG